MIDFENGPQYPMKTLSVSKIEKALMCPLSLKFAYVDRIPRPAAWVLLAGNVLHEIIEHALREFARTGKYPDLRTLDDMYDPIWERRTGEEESKKDYIGWEVDPDDPPEKIRREYRALVRLAREEVLVKIRPWMLGGEPVVEYRIELELLSPVGPFTLLGYADLLDDEGVLCDWKTTEGDVSKRQLRTWLQFAAYSLWAYPIVGEEDLRCEKIFLVRGKKPFVQRKAFLMTHKHREWFVKTAAAVWGMIHHGIFLPNTDHWSCNPKYCSYFWGCRGEIPGEVEALMKAEDQKAIQAEPA